jgi:hypothetical protein
MEEEIVEEVIEEQPPRPVGTFYLKFADEEAFLLACEEAGLIWEDEEGNKHVVFHSHHHALAPLPVLLRGEEYSFDEETGEVTVIKEPEIIPGFHANYSGVLPESFESAVLDPAPATPYMTFG